MNLENKLKEIRNYKPAKVPEQPKKEILSKSFIDENDTITIETDSVDFAGPKSMDLYKLSPILDKQENKAKIIDMI